MNKIVKSILFWMPRILGILFILFIGLFSLDVFGTGAEFWVSIGGFLIHNIRTWILLFVLIVGWKREWVAAAGFLLVGLWFLGIATLRDWGFTLTFAGVPLLTGILFLFSWFERKKARN